MAAPCGLRAGGTPHSLYHRFSRSCTPQPELPPLPAPHPKVHRSVFGKKHCMVVSGAASSDAAVLQCVIYLFIYPSNHTHAFSGHRHPLYYSTSP